LSLNKALYPGIAFPSPNIDHIYYPEWLGVADQPVARYAGHISCYPYGICQTALLVCQPVADGFFSGPDTALG